jgi:hypothetical protein
MLDPQVYWAALTGIFIAAALVAVALCFVSAPYGKHLRQGWGPALPASRAWMMMELPAVLCMAGLFAASGRTANPVALLFLALWQVHYLNRTFVYPLRLGPGARPMPASVVAMGFAFNIWNGYLNGAWLFFLGPELDARHFSDPRLVAGLLLFLAGMALNQQSDAILLRLRAPGETGYQIPGGGMFRLVSAPNYLGELVQWCGWALATWSLPGLGFALFTAANLVPRAWQTHKWYRSHFPDYPPGRRAIIPYIF